MPGSRAEGSEPCCSHPSCATPSFPGETGMRKSYCAWRQPPRDVLRSLLLEHLLLFSPELVHTAQNPNTAKENLGGMGGGSSVLVYQVMREGLRPPPEEQWVALPAPARQQVMVTQPRARRGTGHRKPNQTAQGAVPAVPCWAKPGALREALSSIPLGRCMERVC